MDVFLSEGMEFIFKVALALLLLGKDTLLCLDMEAMLKVSIYLFIYFFCSFFLFLIFFFFFFFNFKFFQKELPKRVDADSETFFQLAYSIKINTKRMKKMEKEYQDLKKKEQEEMIELRRLRRENRLLKQRNELLEAESAELADRLVRGQVSRAEEEETRYYLRYSLI